MKKDVYYCDSCEKEIADDELKLRCPSEMISRGESYKKLVARHKKGRVSVAYPGDFCLECLSEMFRNLADDIDAAKQTLEQ